MEVADLSSIILDIARDATRPPMPMNSLGSLGHERKKDTKLKGYKVKSDEGELKEEGKMGAIFICRGKGRGRGRG